MNSLTLDDGFNMNFGGINNLPSIINIPKGIRNYNITYSFLCYLTKIKLSIPYSKEEQIDLKMQEVFQATGQMMFLGKTAYQQVIYGYTKQNQLMMTYPCIQRYDIDAYYPEIRSWYLDSKKNYKSKTPSEKYNYSITQPYLNFNSTIIGLSLTLPIVDEQLKYLGAAVSDIKIDLLFSDIHKQFGKDFTLIYLISTDGILILHPYNSSINQLPLYFQNESITGFTQDHWEMINNQYSDSNCTEFQYDVKFKCLYNSHYKQMLFLSIEQLVHHNISVLVAMSCSEFNQFQTIFNLSLLKNLYLELYIQLITQICAFFLFSIGIILVTNHLFSPIALIIQMAVSQIIKYDRYLTTSIQLHFRAQFISGQIKNLYESCLHFNKLIDNFSLKKTQQSQIVENFKFPLKQKISLAKRLLLSRDILKDGEILLIEDNTSKNKYQQLNIIRLALKQI